ncbi:DEAD/DEAH box helicase [Paraglaciecola aquimarina]|uniref:DEAD/DEAH box helicase n=1 Tax=Paraglaciecola algarum TaxID=3050085 RepID=A0ABS9DAD7_9ALTE|nr:DEAD/DEAH box helicase [Paraglaciecola sp. G1-23]MCF2949923.1 DEAD/DEAH box helicase [Paraglaciecola sp. G1-23]
MSFSGLGLNNELIKTVTQQGYKIPTQIQMKSIPAILNKRDVMAAAHTGTGKTASFCLPIIQLLSQSKPKPKHTRALIITPTRELAAQVAKSVATYSQHINLRYGVVFGGVRIEPQIAQLQSGLDILVATPGRLLDLYNQQAIHFEQLEILVLDEADRMLDLGFSNEINRIQTLLPNTRQSLLFSATFSKDIKSLAKSMLNHPVLIEASTANSTLDTIKQTLHPVDKTRKSELLTFLITKHKWPQVLVFSRTKKGADSLAAQLNNTGINAESIHANRTQHARTLVLEGFKSGEISVLVATDIAARGIDISQLPCVINFDMPYVPEDYVHRIGRTGRAGSSGLALSLFSADETKQLDAIERLIGRKLNQEVIQGFAPITINKKPPPIKKASNKTLKNSNNKKPARSQDDELYGNFEADPAPKGKHNGRGSRSSRNAKDWR